MGWVGWAGVGWVGGVGEVCCSVMGRHGPRRAVGEEAAAAALCKDLKG